MQSSSIWSFQVPTLHIYAEPAYFIFGRESVHLTMGFLVPLDRLRCKVSRNAFKLKMGQLLSEIWPLQYSSLYITLYWRIRHFMGDYSVYFSLKFTNTTCPVHLVAHPQATSWGETVADWYVCCNPMTKNIEMWWELWQLLWVDLFHWNLIRIRAPFMLPRPAHLFSEIWYVGVLYNCTLAPIILLVFFKKSLILLMIYPKLCTRVIGREWRE